jgi:SAM-dependent methyltransferase
MDSNRRQESQLSADEFHDHIVGDPEDAKDPFTVCMHAARYRLAADRLRGRDLVLEIGCATGYGTSLLAGSCKRVVALDIHPAAASHTARRVNMPAVAADCVRLPFADASFDGAVAFDVIEHLPQPQRMLAELRRVLKPGARLVMSTPNKLASDLVSGKIYAFHEREYYLSEFRDELVQKFPQVELLGQYPDFVDDFRSAAGSYRRRSRFWFVPSVIRRFVQGRARSLIYRSLGMGARGEDQSQLSRMEQIVPTRVDVAHDFIAVIEAG